MYSRQRGRQRQLMQRLQTIFGGQLKFERDREYFETTDGRQIPLSALSSGQQELLPLLLVFEYWLGATGNNSLTFIEEPEAHLFPTAQSDLTQVLATIVMAPKDRIDLVVTTHSPYVLAKVNNLIKAGELANKLGAKTEDAIEKIVGKAAWLSPGTVCAYAMCDGKLQYLMDDDGLINAEYLDTVSGEIAREFSELLAVENQYGTS